MDKQERLQRDKEICDAYKNKVSCIELGKQYNLTRQGVHLILQKNGIPMHPRPKGKKITRTRKNDMHGMSTTRTYRIWNGIIQRCINPNHTVWDYYGGRGIKVCERWKKFINFYEDMGDCPDGMEIDRIDNNGNYEPGNCKWTTRTENLRNRRVWGSSQHNGVTWDKRHHKWKARVYKEKVMYLGSFEEEEEAAAEIERFKREYDRVKKYIEDNNLNISILDMMND